MTNFPFEAVYDYFAKPIVEQGIGDGIFGPLFVTVGVEDGEVVHAMPYPEALIGKFFENGAGKEAFGRVITKALEKIADETFCLVLAMESYYKKQNKETPRDMTKSLADDQDAEEGILIVVYRPEGSRAGMLPILAGRKVEYSPLRDGKPVEGRLAGAVDAEAM